MSLQEALVVALLGGLLVLGAIMLLRVAPVPGAISPSAMMADWDRRVRDMPQHADLRTISERLATVERVCGELRIDLASMKDGVARVERLTNMLLQQQLDRSADPGHHE